MSVLNGNSRFSLAPQAFIERSRFDRSHSHKTTFDAGKLVPIYCEEVLPGDTVTLDLSTVCRMSTPMYPVMDNAYLDVHWFFIPYRLVWSHWREFCGENTDPWSQDTDYEIPHAKVAPVHGGFWDYLGVPPGVSCDVSALPLRAYQLVWNEWYRDQNLQSNQLVDTGDVAELLTGDVLLSVNKYKDYFTSCLPSPQKGEAVLLPLGEWAPVYTRATDVPSDGSLVALKWATNYAGGTGSPVSLAYSGSGGAGSTVVTNGSAGSSVGSAEPTNLWTDLGNATSATVNQLRQAFAVQRLLERDARGGTRYRELVKAHFGVDTGDARVQVPEYLGGKHIPINISQVVQQSAAADEPTPLGNTGAYSKTVDRGSMFTKSFIEHGLLLGLASVRTEHTYQQGFPRYLSRRSRYDFYWPELAHIGEQAVKVSEIYAAADPDGDLVFGYQEAWADYRYSPNRVSGAFRSDSPQSLDVWHYADDYASRPYLSATWVSETDANVARTLAVQDSDVSDQFLLDCYFHSVWTRPMPLYSVPGMAGHF